MVEPGAIDLERFEQLVEEARGQEPAAAAKLLREALSLWRGPAARGSRRLGRAAERAQLEEQRAAALEQRIAADLELGVTRSWSPSSRRWCVRSRYGSGAGHN